MVLVGAVYLHAVFALDPAADVYVPPATDTPDKLLHAALCVPPVHHLPAGHVAHDVLPVVVLYVPAAQVAHADAALEPVLGLAVPAAHAVRPPVKP